jgi:hypothetical protein
MTDNLSDYGKLNEMRKQLVEERDRGGDHGLISRINILIANIDNLKREPTDHALLVQMAKNTRDLERYKLNLQ